MKTIRDLINKKFSIGESIVLDILTEKMKKHFGREFNIERDSVYYDNGVIPFLKKYDERADEHFYIGKENTEYPNTPPDTMVICRLEKGTFMFVASGKYHPDLSYTPESYSKEVSKNMIYIYIFGKKMHRYVKELRQYLKNARSNELGIYSVTANMDREGESLRVTYSSLTSRYPDTMYFSDHEMDQVISHIDKYMTQKKIYENRQLNYKTGILLHGFGGLGKSSIAKVLCSKYNRNLVSIDATMISKMNLDELTASLNCDCDKYIILIEEIDTIYQLDRDGNQLSNEGRSVLNKLLKFLDSNSSPTDTIFVATTNHIDVLDKALLRDRRFDLIVEVKGLLREDAIRFIHSFDIKNENEIAQILDACALTDDGRYVQSSLETQCLKALA